ncbi:MAG TPA: hypothetical protein PKZ42_01660 [Syntrophales bacterium]|nr:hypothetical protein [Syntrophales bacterium]
MALKQIGVLWKKQGKKTGFLSGILDLGVLGKVNIGIFQNEKEAEDASKPDATIVLFENEKAED